MRFDHTKRRWAWLVAVAALALMAAACTSSDDTTTTAAATATTAAPAASASGFCSDTDITFLAGGPPGGPFDTIVVNGAKAAADSFGANVDFVYSDWNPETMLNDFRNAVATGPDGIAIMGHPGSDAYAPLVDDAQSEGILVTSLNTELVEIADQYSGNGFGYAGAVLYSAGFSLGTEAVSRFDLGSDDKAMVWGLLAQAGRGERTQGVIDGLEAGGVTVDYLEIDDATNADPAAGVSTFVGYVAANEDVDIVVTDHGGLTGTLQTYFEAAGLGSDDVLGVGFDLSPPIVEAIRAGWTDLVIDQQPFLQGFMSVAQLCLTHNFAFTGLHIDTGAGFAHADNIELLGQLVTDQIR